MSLEKVLSLKKEAIVDRWFQLITETYTVGASLFLRQKNDRFANPVGYSLAKGIEGLFDGLLAGETPEKLSPFLDDIVRIRAVQDFSPSEAVAFVFFLKKIVREELESGVRDRVSERLLEFESRIDRLALLAFDIYMGCREKIFEIRVNELKAQTVMHAGRMM